MPDNGFGWHLADRPATSDEIVSAQAHYYNHAIDCFGPDRCMFESNFPVDRLSVSYRVLYNAFKKIAMQYSDQEQAQMFADTALDTYRI
jgi:predicted TIM-barrel fold metal-dependent hydrolase